MAKKYSRFKTKIHPLAYVIGALFLVIAVVVIVLSIPSQQTKFYQSYYKAQAYTENFNYESLIEKDHLFKTTNVKKLEKLIDQEEVVIVYIGGTWCSTCLNEVAEYDKELRKNEKLFEVVKNIYYLEQKTKDDEVKGLADLLEKFDYELPSSLPVLLTFINGQLAETKYSAGSQDVKSIRTTILFYYDNILEEIEEAQ